MPIETAYGNQTIFDLLRESLCLSLPVMLLVHKMVSGSECHQVSIVGWCGDRNGSCAAHIGVTELVRQQLEFICGEAIVIPQDVIV